jgi:tRNA pseudouridine32 synthase/23S rRNA pseudouridine746 synthase
MMAPMAGEGRFSLRRTVGPDDLLELGSFLQQHTGLSRGALKDALGKGALRIRRAGERAELRVRKADAVLAPGDRVELCYDAELLGRTPPEAELLEDLGPYSFWLKPAGLLAQGNSFGDHCSLLRQVELWARRARREAYLLHRLDRETIGVMVFAHTRRGAAELSRVFASGGARKRYRAVVHGRVEARSGRSGSFDASLDGRAAMTSYEVLSYDEARVRTTVSVTPQGGRLHQIRRHFRAAGFPLVGDPRYGRGDGEPLRLVATSLGFHSAMLGREVEVSLPEERIGF